MPKDVDALRSYLAKHYPGENLIASVSSLPERTLGRETAKHLLLGGLADIGRPKYHLGLTGNRLIVLNTSTQQAQVYDRRTFTPTLYGPPHKDREGRPVEAELWIRYDDCVAPVPPSRQFAVPKKKDPAVRQLVARMFEVQASGFMKRDGRRAGRTGAISHLATMGGGSAHDVCYSQNGSLFAIGTSIGAYLCDSRTLDVVRFFPSVARTGNVAFSPDGRLLAYSDRVIYVWNLTTNEMVAVLGHAGGISGLAFSGDGRLLASSGDDATARIWEVSTWKPMQIIEERAQAICDIVLAPDGRWFAYSQGLGPWRYNPASVRDTASGKRIRQHCKRVGDTAALSVSRDGSLLAAAGYDKTIRIWRTARGSQLCKLKGHSDRIVDLDFSPDSRLVASGSDDGTVRLWRIKDRKCAFILKPGHDVQSVAFSPDARVLAAAGQQGVYRWNVTNGASLPALDGFTRAATSTALYPGNSSLAVAYADGRIRLWRSKRLADCLTFDGHADSVHHVAFSPDGRWLASVGKDQEALLWDAKTGTIDSQLAGRRRRSDRVIAFAPDNLTLASAGTERDICIWDLRTGRVLYSLTSGRDATTSVAYSPGGRLLASASQDGGVKVWRIDGRAQKAFEDRCSGVTDIAFSHDGRVLVTVDRNGDIVLRHVVDWQVAAHLQVGPTDLTNLATSPTDHLLAAGDVCGVIYLWNLKSQRLIDTLTAHSDSVSGLGFSADGQLLASCSRDGTASIWRIK